MNMLQTEWWTIAVPLEWWADQEDETILIGDRDDVGCIEITTLLQDKVTFDEEEVRDIANSDREIPINWELMSLHDFDGIYGCYEEEKHSIREWYLSNGPLLLFISYTCELENEEMDITVVNQILETIEPIELKKDQLLEIGL